MVTFSFYADMHKVAKLQSLTLQGGVPTQFFVACESGKAAQAADAGDIVVSAAIAGFPGVIHLSRTLADLHQSSASVSLGQVVSDPVAIWALADDATVAAGTYQVALSTNPLYEV